MPNEKDQTIIIKKIKKSGHGHHGGAWKVAYADFVTAMMAFFLLLWLLTSTPVENLQGLADYFSPTLGLQGKLGIGFKGGRAPNTEGASTGDWASKGLIFGSPPSGPLIRLPDQADNDDRRDNPQVTFLALSEKTVAEGVERAMQDYQNVKADITADGIEITLSDSNDKALFAPGSAEPTAELNAVITKAAAIIKAMPHYIEIRTFTRRDEHLLLKDEKKRFPGLWELSTERSHAVRRALAANGMDPEQIASVTGGADHELINYEEPENIENSRTVIVLLTRARAGVNKQPAPEDILFE